MDLNDFLLTIGKVPENQIKYYLIWISKCNAYSYSSRTIGTF